jgi:hypothetical protein
MTPEYQAPAAVRPPPDQLTFDRTTINLALSYDENTVSGNQPSGARV